MPLPAQIQSFAQRWNWRFLLRFLLPVVLVTLVLLYSLLPPEHTPAIISNTIGKINWSTPEEPRESKVDLLTTWSSPRGSKIALLTTWSGPDTIQLGISNRLRKEYGDKWKYDIHFFRDMKTGKPPFWDGMYAMKELIKLKPDTEWFWLVDVDLTIMNVELSLEEHVFKPLGLLPGSTKDQKTIMLISADCNQLNAGSFFLRNSPDTETLLDFWMDKAYGNWYFAEQDAISHIYTNVPWAQDRIMLVPPRMINSYMQVSCPMAGCNGNHQVGEFDPELLKNVRRVPGYDYGTDDTYGWDTFDFENTNWLPGDKVRMVPNGRGGVKKQSKSELQGDYKRYTEAHGLTYDPLLLSPDHDFPMLPPFYTVGGNGWESRLSPEDLEHLDYQFWTDKRARDGRYHYRAGDLVLHTAGCGHMGLDCAKLLQTVENVRLKVQNGTYDL